MEDEIVLVASPSHPLAQAGRISLKDVPEEGIIVREQGSATRRTAEREFESLGFSPSIALELGSNQAVKQAASAAESFPVWVSNLKSKPECCPSLTFPDGTAAAL